MSQHLTRARLSRGVLGGLSIMIAFTTALFFRRALFCWVITNEETNHAISNNSFSGGTRAFQLCCIRSSRWRQRYWRNRS
jgi:hypothetical protein